MRRRKSITAASMMILLGLAGTPALSQNALPSEVSSLPAAVHQVVSGGYWSKDGAEGSFRVVVLSGGVEHINHDLYLQWIKVDPETGGSSVVHSLGIKQINDGHAEGYVLKVVHDESEFDVFRLRIEVNRTRSRDTLNFRLDATAEPGSYTINQVD